uniref:Uncharacterized protein n=1 Tax=Plectus sambesii TaxID=2011161 RepID=A0A914VH90_9BILA
MKSFGGTIDAAQTRRFGPDYTHTRAFFFCPIVLRTSGCLPPDRKHRIKLRRGFPTTSTADCSFVITGRCCSTTICLDAPAHRSCGPPHTRARLIKRAAATVPLSVT